jgi:hypothetical protein
MLLEMADITFTRDTASGGHVHTSKSPRSFSSLTTSVTPAASGQYHSHRTTSSTTQTHRHDAAASTAQVRKATGQLRDMHTHAGLDAIRVQLLENGARIGSF